MSLRNYKTSKTIVAIAMLAVFIFHGGIIYAITYVNSRASEQMMSEPATVIMHRMSLAGLDTAQEVTNQHDDEELLTEPTESDTEIKEEKVEAEKVEEKSEPETESIVDNPKEEIITTQRPMPQSPKIQAKKKEKPQPKPQQKKQQAKPQPKRQSKRVENRIFSMQDLSVLAKPAPNYPRSVLMRRMGGTTILLIKINEQGQVVSVKIEKSSGNDQIDKAAVTAGHKVRLKPYIVDGKPQAIVVRIPYQLKF